LPEKKISMFKNYIAQYLKNDSSKDFEINIPSYKGIAFAEKIKKAILTNKKIFVYGDYDVDGIGSTAFMVSIIKDMAKFNYKKTKVDYRVPSRAEHYGLKYDFFKAALKSYDLFITVDNGTHREFFNMLSDEDKKKILIIDHHPNGDFGKEENVINPNIDGSVSISTGILIEYLHQCFRKIDKDYANKRDVHHYKDYVAITLISDMANVNNKTIRGFITKGLEKISARNRPLYSHFFPDWKKDITVEDIAFDLIPKLNSVGRLGLELDWIVEAWTSQKDTDFVKESYLKLEDTNEQRKEALNYYSKLIEKEIEESGVNLSEASLLYYHRDDVPIGLNGLIAGNLAQKYKTNALFTSINYGGDEQAIGSGRGGSIKKTLIEVAEKYKDVRESIQFGGHLRAVGLRARDPKILSERIAEFNKNTKKKIIENGKFLVSNKNISVQEYLSFCKEYSEICGSIPLNDSFYSSSELLVLGFDEYRNDFVKVLCQDKNGDMIEIITKSNLEIDLLSANFQEVALEIKTVSDINDDMVIFTNIETKGSLSQNNNQANKIDEASAKMKL